MENDTLCLVIVWSFSCFRHDVVMRMEVSGFIRLPGEAYWTQKNHSQGRKAYHPFYFLHFYRLGEMGVFRDCLMYGDSVILSLDSGWPMKNLCTSSKGPP